VADTTQFWAHLAVEVAHSHHPAAAHGLCPHQHTRPEPPPPPPNSLAADVAHRAQGTMTPHWWSAPSTSSLAPPSWRWACADSGGDSSSVQAYCSSSMLAVTVLPRIWAPSSPRDSSSSSTAAEMEPPGAVAARCKAAAEGLGHLLPALQHTASSSCSSTGQPQLQREVDQQEPNRMTPRPAAAVSRQQPAAASPPAVANQLPLTSFGPYQARILIIVSSSCTTCHAHCLITLFPLHPRNPTPAAAPNQSCHSPLPVPCLLSFLPMTQVPDRAPRQVLCHVLPGCGHSGLRLPCRLGAPAVAAAQV
jgi:hypothetical protein